MLRRRLWLCLPPVLCCCLDATLTLTGQSAAYWAGDFAAAQEANPVCLVLLRLHPLALGVGMLLWAAAFTVAVLRLTRGAAAVLACGLAFSHAFGAATWLFRWGLPGWLLAGATFAVASGLVSLSWRSVGFPGPTTPARP
jgi:hypothetical protein